MELKSPEVSQLAGAVLTYNPISKYCSNHLGSWLNTCMKLYVPCIWAMRSWTACFLTTGSLAGGGVTWVLATIASVASRVGGWCCREFANCFTRRQKTQVHVSAAAWEIILTGAQRINEAHLSLHRPLLHLVLFCAAVRGRFWNVLSVHKLEDRRQTSESVRTKSLGVTSDVSNNDSEPPWSPL